MLLTRKGAAVKPVTHATAARVEQHWAELTSPEELEALRRLRFLGWFAAGTLELSYGRYFQSTSFGGPSSDKPWWCLITCVVQVGYSMPY